jgi:hypothetical protein
MRAVAQAERRKPVAAISKHQVHRGLQMPNPGFTALDAQALHIDARLAT